MQRVYAREEVCMACTLCEVHCIVQHSQSRDLIKAFKKEIPRPLARIRVEQTALPDGYHRSFALQCRHCPEPDCVYGCISGAMHRDERGVVTVDTWKCVGCWTCILVCPYGAISRDEGNRRVASKCDLCPGEEVPVCVRHCPNEALVLAEEGQLPVWAQKEEAV